MAVRPVAPAAHGCLNCLIVAWIPARTQHLRRRHAAVGRDADLEAGPHAGHAVAAHLIQQRPIRGNRRLAGDPETRESGRRDHHLGWTGPALDPTGRRAAVAVERVAVVALLASVADAV